MLGDVVTIIGILAGLIVVIGAIVAVAKSGFNIFAKINKIENIDKATNALLFIHRDELFALYKDQIKIVFNPIPYPHPEKDALLEKLQKGYLTYDESKKLTEILKYEEAEAKRKDQQIAVLVIGALLLLVALAAKK